ncbi:MAG TPA: helix-turn-helix domain-containing protein [Acetobacteraceae bacterium]|nr:helix-turn-helix domain-containing protein [Acetobacteraceae bacterium]
MVCPDDGSPAGLTQPGIVPQHVKHALDYLRAHLGDRVTLAGLAAACGAPERTLLKQFKRFLGVSPLAHLHRMRLAAARNELLRPDDDGSVSDTAMRCGFSHLGRFAAGYHRMFGEHPSTTRRRASQQACNRWNGEAHPAEGAPARIMVAARERPSLLIAPMRSETLQERRAAQELIEQVAAALSRMQVASVRLADPILPGSNGLLRNGANRAGTQYCLQGRLSQRAERVRATFWLADAGTGRHVWGDSYDGTMDDAFDVQQRVVEGVLCGVVPGITTAEIQRIHNKDPEALCARELALQALPLVLKTDAVSSRRGFALASRAMEMDPDDALPVALAAYCQARLFTGDGSGQTRNLALHLAQRAGSLDVGDPLVTTARGAVATLMMQRDDAESLVTRAIAMDPTSGWAWERRGYARLLCGTDADLVIADFRRAMQLHGPFMPRDNCFNGIAQAHRCAGRYEEAVHWTHRALAENPRAAWLHRPLVCYSSRLGDQSAARRSADNLSRAHPELTVSRLADTGLMALPECLEFLAHAGVPV